MSQCPLPEIIIKQQVLLAIHILECVVPENIHTPPTERDWKCPWGGGGGGPKIKFFKEMYKI